MVRRAPLGALPVEPHEALGAERDGRRLRFPQATRMRAPVTEWLLLDGLRSGILLRQLVLGCVNAEFCDGGPILTRSLRSPQ